MYVDEKIAFIEKKILASSMEGDIKMDRWILKDVIGDIKSGFMECSNHQRLEFETKHYFNNNVPIIQIKDFYTSISEEENEICMSREEYKILQRFCFYKIECDNWEKSFWQWIMDAERRCNKQEMSFITEKIKNTSNLCYCCYKLKSGLTDYYNIMFKVKNTNVQIMGTFHCLLSDKNTYGVLLEALLRATFEN